MTKAHSPINWQNSPSVSTPINESNLNKMDKAIGVIDDRVVSLDTTKANQTDMLTAITNVDFNEDTGIFTFTRKNGTTIELDTKLEKVVVNFSFDAETQILYLNLQDGTKLPIDLSAFVTNVEFENTATIRWEKVAGGKMKAYVIGGSITADMIEPNYLANVQLYAGQAMSSASSAKTSEEEAEASAKEAEASAVRAEEAADRAAEIAGGDFATNTKVDNIINGTTPVGNANKLGGKEASEYALNASLVQFSGNGEQLTTSLFDKALEVEVGVHQYANLGGTNHTMDDMPNAQYRYGSATIYKRNASDIVVILWGRRDYKPQINYYDGTSWLGWNELSTVNEITKAMEEYVYPYNSASTEDELTEVINGLFANASSGSISRDRINVGFTSSNLGSGTFYVETFKNSTTSGWQKFFGYKSGKLYCERTLTSGTWSNFYYFATTADLANYLPKTGGDIYGTALFGDPSKAEIMNFILRNNLAYRNFQTLADGSFRLYDAKNNKVAFNISADGATNTWNGTATGNLPLSGGKISAKHTTPLIVENNTDGATISATAYYAKGTGLGSIGFRAVDTPTMFGMNNSYDFLHTGNVGDYAITTHNGGTVEKNSEVPVYFKNTSANKSFLGFAGVDGILGSIGFNKLDSPVVYSVNLGTQQLLHTGNKPSGTYTGNDTNRTIETGGNGIGYLICGSNGTMAIVAEGAIGASGSTLKYIGSGNVRVQSDGKIYLASRDETLNASGVTYTYQAI